MGRSKKKTSKKEKRYLVEDILNKKFEDGKILYLIKWEGYSGSKCTWEPSENLNKALIRRYEKSITQGIPFILIPSDESSDDDERDNLRMKEILAIQVMDNVVYCKILFSNGSIRWVPRNKVKNQRILQDFKDKKDGDHDVRGNSSIESLDETSSSIERSTIETRSSNQSIVYNYDLRYSWLKRKKNPPRRSSRLNTYNFIETTPSHTPCSSGSSFTWTNDTINTLENTSCIEKPITKQSKVDINNDKVYIVDAIVDHRVVNGITEYRIRWEGYTSKDDTWQTADTFNDPNIIAEYEKESNKSIDKSLLSNNIQNISNEMDDCLLDTIMSEAKKGKKYHEKEILGVLAMQYNKKNEKYYLIQLINKNVVPIHSNDIPDKFKNECLRLDKRQSFG